MAIIDPLMQQQISVSRDTTVSDERLREERAAYALEVKHRDSVGPRRTITITDPDRTSRTFRTGDKIWLGPGCVRSGTDWEALRRDKDIVSLTDSQYAINNDLPEARYIIAPHGKAIITRTGIKSPGEIVTALDFARPPYPESRSFINGRWLEVGELDPGSDGTEKLNELLALGRVIDRKLIGRATTAAKRMLSPKGKASGQ